MFKKSNWMVLGISVMSLFAAFTATQARADAKDFYFHRAQMRAKHSEKLSALFSAVRSQATPDSWYAQKIDHTNASDTRTFQQRFWFDASNAQGSNAPTILYICGEATCSAADMESAVGEAAQKLGANIIALEHRYYGKSQPFTSLTTDNLKYLTIHNALEDLASFEQYAKTTLNLTGRWIAVGGSYPGALSAYFRAIHPELVSGSLASSAPVQARENFEDYDRHVFEVAGPQCAASMRQVVKMAEDALNDPNAFASIKAAFAASAITDNDDFLYVIADVGASAVQYGMRDEFCNSLTAATAPNDVLTAYGNFAQQVYSMWGVDAFGFSAESAQNLDPDSYLAGFGQRQWMYQSCTQFGFFQNAYHDPAYSVRSARINPAYHRNLCKRLFGIDQPVDIAGTNQNFYTPVLTSGSNILMTNGSSDPWSLLGITQANGNNTNPNLSVLMIDGAAHCSDLGGDSPGDTPAITTAKQEFPTLAASWLKN
jgi:pimeloyl-ACP methyl ester carboxylesterase